MNEPRTAAGRDMLANHGYRRPVSREWIAAIERESWEAAIADGEALRVAARSLVEALPYVPGSALGGKIALVIAALPDESDCPRCGDWRDSPTSDCANCGRPAVPA